jgi:hypothetical protein
MLLDLQILSKGEEIRHRSNLDFETAHQYLSQIAVKYSAVSIQIYQIAFTTNGHKEAMPYADIEVETIEQAHHWLSLQERIAKGHVDKL